MKFVYEEREFGPSAAEDVILADFRHALSEAHPQGLQSLRLSRTMVGDDYDCELLVVGVRGLPLLAVEASDPTGSREALERFTSTSAASLELAARSEAEERVVLKLLPLLQFNRQSDGPSGLVSLAWTHLQRLFDVDGTPLEHPAVVAASSRLLERERDRLRPKRMLVLTDWQTFAPYARAMHGGFSQAFEILGSDDVFAEAVGRICGCLVVVLGHGLGCTSPLFGLRAARWLAPSDALMSAPQQRACEEVSGYPWDGHTLEGCFETDAGGWDRNQPRSGDGFEYALRPSTGHLFMSLFSRFSGTRSYGFDREGAELPRELILRRFPERD